MHLKKIKFLVYSTQCKPILEYASKVWDPLSKQLKQQIEAVQCEAVRIIKNLKGRRDSITGNLKLLDMKFMRAIRQACRISLFHSILEQDELFPTFISTLNTLKLSNDIITRIANNVNSLTCSTTTFLHRFLIRTARELCTSDIIMD